VPDATFKACRPFVAVHKDAALAKVWFAACVKVFVGIAQLAKIVCSFGPFRIW
jgi:hypothetical protein